MLNKLQINIKKPEIQHKYTFPYVLEAAEVVISADDPTFAKAGLKSV